LYRPKSANLGSDGGKPPPSVVVTLSTAPASRGQLTPFFLIPPVGPESRPALLHLDLPADAATILLAGNVGPECSNGSRMSTDLTPANCGQRHGGRSDRGGLAFLYLPPGPPHLLFDRHPGVTLYTQPAPYPPAKPRCSVFEDGLTLTASRNAVAGIDVVAAERTEALAGSTSRCSIAGGTGYPTRVI